MTRDIIKAALQRYRAAAKDAEKNAVFDGEIGDGGCSRMLDIANAFEAGLENRLPSFLEYYVKDIMKSQGPEFAKYLELKKKFET
jgi:hypothetical protein